METKHTKIKWCYDFSPLSGISPNGQFVVRIDNNIKTPICVLPMPIGGLNTKEKQESNAKLISAAPELLEALVKLYNSLPDGYISECLPEVRKAIEKATK